MFPTLSLFGIAIPMYGLLMTLGIALALWLTFRRVKRFGLDPNNLWIIGACMLALGLFGGQLLYVATAYSWEQIAATIRAGQALKLLNGGMVFYGGLLGGLLGGYLGSLIARTRYLDYLYALFPTVPLAHAIGRIGCFCTGCCYGCETTLPIGVVYTHPLGGAPTGVPLLPVQLIEAAANLLLFFALLLYERRYFGKHPKVYLLCLYAACYAVIRFALECFRYDGIRGFALGLSTSQWISIGMLLAAALCFLAVRARRKKRLS